MRRTTGLLLYALMIPIGLAGCKVVKNAERDAQQAAAEAKADVVGDTVNTVWDPQVLTHIEQSAVALDRLLSQIAADLDQAGTAHGYRQNSEGSPWNFATRFSGVVLEANTKSKAASAAIDIDDDGVADAVIQLGPVIRGTALRDVLPFISFTDFRDQIEFAKLARALNARAYETALKDLPRAALTGRTLSGAGVFTVRAAGGKILITPSRLSVAP